MPHVRRLSRRRHPGLNEGQKENSLAAACRAFCLIGAVFHLTPWSFDRIIKQAYLSEVPRAAWGTY